MARAKRKVVKEEKKLESPQQTRQTRFPNFLLGLTFLIVVLLLISLFFKSNGTQFSLKNISNLFTRSNSPIPAATVTPTPSTDKATAGEDYIVRPGDTLWSIAEEAYGSGYNSADIIAANKLPNPAQIEVGQHINLPKVEAKTPTRGEIAGQTAAVTQAPTQEPTHAPTQEQAQSQKEYTVKRGDNLWNIAVQVYGDGFQWKRIAEANNLVNPRLIHAGNHLTLPQATS